MKFQISLKKRFLTTGTSNTADRKHKLKAARHYETGSCTFCRILYKFKFEMLVASVSLHKGRMSASLRPVQPEDKEKSLPS